MEFKIGDKVRVINMNNAPKAYGDMTNKMGIIKWKAPSEWGNKRYGIAFEDVKNRSSANGYFYFSNDNLELICNNIPALSEIKEKKLSCVIHTKTQNEAKMLVKLLGVNKNYVFNPIDAYIDYIDFWGQNKENTCYRIIDGKVSEASNCQIYAYEGETIYDFSDLFATGGTVSIHDLPTSEWSKFTFGNGSSIEALPQKDDAVWGNRIAYAPDGSPLFQIPTPVIKEEKKMPTKFTFCVTDWVDIDKTNGEKIPMKRTVAYIGSNTDVEADTSCPVAEYDERIGCLIAAAKISAKRSTEAKMMYNIARSTWGTELSWAIFFELANSAFNGNFDRVYKKFHNDNIRFEKKRLTCNFCGKVFETIEEKTKHENEHIQNKKNKREKYLIRKEAKRRLAEAEREGKIEQIMKELHKK